MLQDAINELGKLTNYKTSVYRIVETQEYAATMNLVDDLEEQELLEQLLDEVKPPYKKGTQKLHYLISTPFRYPPLKYGSRFGDRTMPSYFYGSEHVETCLAECAFYRFVFLSHMSEPYEKAINTIHTSFNVKASSKNCADLTTIKSHKIKAVLESKDNYQFTQKLGKTLVEDLGADLIRYVSARKPGYFNIAISEPKVITSKKPENSVNWFCMTTTHKISFNTQGRKPLFFHIDDFTVNGLLPSVAS